MNASRSKILRLYYGTTELTGIEYIFCWIHLLVVHHENQIRPDDLELAQCLFSLCFLASLDVYNDLFVVSFRSHHVVPIQQVIYIIVARDDRI